MVANDFYLMFSKKYLLQTPFLTKCSECDLDGVGPIDNRPEKTSCTTLSFFREK